MDIKQMLIETGALLEGHFKLSSGLHSDKYVQCAQLLKKPHYAQKCGEELAKLIDVDVDVVISPAMGGLFIGHETAKALNKDFLFTERNDENQMELRRNFKFNKGDKILIVEDVVTTGKSTKEVIRVIEELGGNVVALASIVNRTKQETLNGLKLNSLIKVDAITYEEKDCPMCKEGSEATKPGSRKF